MPVRVKLSRPQGALFDAATQVVQSLREAGFQAFWVGGAVRDMKMEEIPEDIDLVTNATPEEAQSVFPDLELVGASFGVALVKQDGFTFELATCREERGYTDGRRPSEVRYTKNFEVDLQRRDFTVNAMLYDPEEESLIDYVGALVDLEDGNIRAVGNPMIRLNEDYLRMLRAIRFAAKMDFNLAPSTFNAIGKLAGKCRLLAPERIQEELDRMLTGRAPGVALRLLKSSGVLAVLLPAVEALAGVTQPKEYHPEGDVWQHTLLMFDHIQKPCDVDLAWSILLHDIGKVPTRTVDENNIPHFYGHEVESALMAEAILTQLHFSKERIERIVHAVRNHMRFASVREMREAKLKRLMAEPDFAMELELHRVDCMASHQMMETYDFLREKQQTMEKDGMALPEALLNGGDLQAAGYCPGPLFREILEAVTDEQLDGTLTDRESALAWVLEHYPLTSKESEATE